MKKILLIGGGGHCHSVLDSLLSLHLYEVIGVVDRNKHICIEGATVVGQDNELPQLFDEGWKEAFVTVGSVGDTSLRRRLYCMAKTIGFSFPVIVDPTASLAQNVKIMPGTYVGKKAVVNSNCYIGMCSIINTGAIIEHDCKIGEFSHVSPGAILCGEVEVGRDSHIGAGAIIRQQIQIGSESVIGMGSSVVRNIPDKVLAYGNPCKVVK